MAAPLTTVALELLDSSQCQALQRWNFPEAELIRIGRSADNDIVVGSPYVSRAHARLEIDGDDWRLLAVSDKGVFVDGRRVESLVLREGTVFRLSAQGPFLRVAELDDGQDVDELGTLSVDPSEVTFLSLDATRRDREVEEIARGDYFQNLQRLARQLRARRMPS